MKNDTPFDPESYIRLIQLLLMGLEDILSADELNEDIRSDELKRKLQSYRNKVSRINSVLSKHRDAERRKKDLKRDNRQRNQER